MYRHLKLPEPVPPLNRYEARNEFFSTSHMSKDKNIPAKIVYVCTGSKCKKKGGKEISKSLRNYASEHALSDVAIIKTHCTDNCKIGPVVCFQPDNAWHFHVDEHKAIALLKKYREHE